VTAVEHPAADRAAAYVLEPILIDGNDADAVHAVAVRTVGMARAGEGPSLVEALTYRHGGHSRADPGKYRPEEEVADWLRRDPIPMYRERLLAAGADEGTLDRIDREVLETVDRATQEAREAPFPDPQTLETELWAEGGSAWRN
jgi:acetoin:2,6-dichlorophenolindophenol oxidoreductase subunit alpha